MISTSTIALEKAFPASASKKASGGDPRVGFFSYARERADEEDTKGYSGVGRGGRQIAAEAYGRGERGSNN
jgi:hypothetical protein